LLDTREREDYASSHISGAKNIPDDELSIRGPRELNKTEVIVTYCGCEGVNQMAASTLIRMGFRKVYMLQGGRDTWEKAGLAVVTRN